MKRWTAGIEYPRQFRAEIREFVSKNITNNSSVTVYELYVYENGEKAGYEMQQQLIHAMEDAAEFYGIPLDTWQQVED